MMMRRLILALIALRQIIMAFVLLLVGGVMTLALLPILGRRP